MSKSSSRFLVGLVCLLFVIIPGFLLIGATIPHWNARPDEINRSLPGDEIVSQPELTWNHGITIHATPGQIYPWLIQMGDSRAGFYSFTFIENLFMLLGRSDIRYLNADRIHAEWQNPPKGQGVISNWMAIVDCQPEKFVLASATPEFFGMQWTWLWYIQPVDQGITRLIVRHRFAFPGDTPKNLMIAVLDAGYVMERSMMLGIRNRAEGNIPLLYSEPLEIALWLVAFVCGLAGAIRFILQPGHYHPLGIWLEAVVVLFIFTFVQPAIWLRIIIDLVLVFSVVIAYRPVNIPGINKAGNVVNAH